MERITRGVLERQVRLLKSKGIEVVLDHHQPGGNKFTWAVENTKGGRLFSGRMTARECCLFLAGMLTVAFNEEDL
jgi:hypothetical protein